MKDKLIKLGLTDELAQKVLDNFGTVIDGEYIPKHRFNEVNTELKTAKETITARDKQIDDLGKNSTDLEALKKEKEDLIKANKIAKEESDKALATERKNNAIKLELIGKVHNTDVAMSLLNGEEIVIGEDGKVKSGLKEQLDGLKKTQSYLFIPETKPVNNNFQVKGATPKDGDSTEPTNLSAGEVLAKTLAKAANETVKATAESTYFGTGN